MPAGLLFHGDVKISPKATVQRRPAPEIARSVVPGEYPQVQADLVSFGEPVLNLLDEYGVKVAVLDDGQTLAESPALRFPTDEEYAHGEAASAGAAEGCINI